MSRTLDVKKDRLAILLVPFVSALCPFSERLTMESTAWLAREVSATLSMQPKILIKGLWVYLWVFDMGAMFRYGSRFANLDQITRARILEHSRFPFWGLARKALSTLVSLNAFDELDWHGSTITRRST